MQKIVRCIVIPANDEPYIIKVRNELEEFQKLVDGHIETVSFSTDAILVVNEEGILLDLPRNENIKPCIPSGLDIYGDAVIVGVDGEEFVSLDADIAQWFLEKSLSVYLD